MNAVLNKSAKQVKTLSARANKGTIKSLYLQIEMGKLILEGYTYWKANKKIVGLDRDGLSALYGVGNTFFGQLKNASKIPIEDTEKYIQSLGNEPTASIKGLLDYMKPDPTEKPKTLYTFSISKEIGGGGARFDEKLNAHVNGNEAEIIEHLKTLLNELEVKKDLATIELTELIEA